MTGLPNILDYGGNNNNAADNDNALRSALAANTAYPTCFFPPGKYRFASNFNYGPVNAAALSLFGCGPDLSELTWPNANGGISVNGSGGGLHFRDMSLTTNAKGSGTAILMMGSFGVAANDFNNVAIRGADGYQASCYWAGGINIVGAWNTRVAQCQIIGSPNAIAGQGIVVSNPSATTCVLSVADTLFTFLGDAFTYGPNFQGVRLSGCDFTNNHNALVLPDGPDGRDLFDIDGCQIGPRANGFPIVIKGAIRDLKVRGCLIFINPYTNGLDMSKIQFANIVGNTFSGGPGANTNANGIIIHSNHPTNAATISGNTFYNLTTGVVFDSGVTGWVLGPNAYHDVATRYWNPGTNPIISGG